MSEQISATEQILDSQWQLREDLEGLKEVLIDVMKGESLHPYCISGALNSIIDHCNFANMVTSKYILNITHDERLDVELVDWSEYAPDDVE